MTGERPPIPVQVKEPPPQTQVPGGAPSSQPPSVEPPLTSAQALGQQPAPKGEGIPPASAEPIQGITLETAHKQILGWAGHVDTNATPKEIIGRINRIRADSGQKPLEGTPEIIDRIRMAQLYETDRIVDEAKKKEEAKVGTPKPEEPPEQTKEQIKDANLEAWNKAADLLIAAESSNLFDENASGLSDVDKSTRIQIKKAIARLKEIKQAVEEVKTAMVKKENEARAQKIPPEPALNEEAERDLRAKLDKQLRREPERLQTARCSYDKTTKSYKFKNDRGEPIDEFPASELVEPVHSGLRILKEQKGTDGQPTPDAKTAEDSLQVLEKNLSPDKTGYRALTESELQAERAHKEIFDTAYRAVAYYLGKDIADALVAGTTDKYDVTKVLERIKAHPNMALADMAATLYLYHHAGTNNPTVQGNIDAALYYQLQGLSINNADNPNLVSRIKNLSSHEPLMAKRLKDMRSVVDGYLREHHIDPKMVKDQNIIRILTLSTFFEGKTTQDARGVIHLKDDVQGVLTTLRQTSQGLINEADAEAITQFAHNGIGSGLMRVFYGADVKELLNGKTVGECASFVVGELIRLGQSNPDIQITEVQREIATQILKAHMTETGLRRLGGRFAELLGESKGLLIIFALFAGSINDLMNTGVSAGERGREGG